MGSLAFTDVLDVVYSPPGGNCGIGAVSCLGQGRMLMVMEENNVFPFGGFKARRWLSTNDGATWSEILPLLDEANDEWGHSLLSLGFNRAVLGTLGPDIADHNYPADMIQLTTDGGVSWTKVVADALYTTTDFWEFDWFIALDAAEVWALGGFTLLGVAGQILRSFNNGGAFASPIAIVPSAGVMQDLFGGVSLGTNIVIVGGAVTRPARVFRTTNRGTSFTEILLPNTQYAPKTATTGSAIHAIANLGGGVLLAGGSQQAPDGLGGTVLPAKLWRSTDDGVIWTEITDSLGINYGLANQPIQTTVKRIVSLGNGRAVVAVDGKPSQLPGASLWFLTEDAGLTFTPCAATIPSPGTFEDLFDLAVGDPGTVVAVTRKAGANIAPSLWYATPVGFTATGPCASLTPPTPGGGGIPCPADRGNFFPTADTEHLDFGNVAVGNFKTLTLTITNHSLDTLQVTMTIT